MGYALIFDRVGDPVQRGGARPFGTRFAVDRRLSGDASLNAPIRASEGESGEWQDWLVDDHENAEEILVEQDELENRRGMLAGAMSVLNDRERRIFEARRLAEEPMTLEELSAGRERSAGVARLASRHHRRGVAEVPVRCDRRRTRHAPAPHPRHRQGEALGRVY